MALKIWDIYYIIVSEKSELGVCPTHFHFIPLIGYINFGTKLVKPKRKFPLSFEISIWNFPHVAISPRSCPSFGTAEIRAL